MAAGRTCHSVILQTARVNLPIRFLRDGAMLKFVCESGVKLVTTSAGSPARFIAPLKAAGITVYHAVPTVEAALKCVDAGIDGLVVEGAEGGGFKNPEEVSTLVLLQGIRARSDVPMIAAGGICDGRGMAAAFALGAEGLMAPDALKGIRDVYFHGDMEAAPALAGQSAGPIDEVKPAKEIIEETVAQFFAIAGRLGGLAAAKTFG